MNKTILLVVGGLIAFGIATRFIFIADGQSWLPNFTAIGAIALFGANYLKGAWRFALPFAALWLSDLVLNNVVYRQYYESFQVIGNLWVYAGFLISIVLGIVIMKKPSWLRLFYAAIGTGTAFYLITNFAVWVNPTTPYMKNFSGLVECYLAAVPFFRNTLLGNVFYSAILFGAYEMSARYLVQLRTRRQLVLA